MQTDAIARPLLIYDGDCSFCRRNIERWKNLTGEAIGYEPYQSAADRFGQIPREAFGKSVFLVEPDGRITHAAEAVFTSLALAGRCRPLLWAYRHVPLFGRISEAIYTFVAGHRENLDRWDQRLVRRKPTSPSRGSSAAK